MEPHVNDRLRPVAGAAAGRLPRPRGFALLAVILVLTVVALLGLTAVTVATLDEGTAAARGHRAQAVVAAETGLALYSLVAAPNVDCGAAEGTSLLAADLPALHTDRREGADIRPRFTVTVADQAPGVDGCQVQVLGEVRDGAGRVMAEAMLHATVQHQRSQWGYGGQKDYNPQGTGSDTTGRLGYHPDI
jgi:type II secretory pathway pseudopilin PulG